MLISLSKYETIAIDNIIFTDNSRNVLIPIKIDVREFLYYWTYKICRNTSEKISTLFDFLLNEKKEKLAIEFLKCILRLLTETDNKKNKRIVYKFLKKHTVFNKDKYTYIVPEELRSRTTKDTKEFIDKCYSLLVMERLNRR